MLYRTLLIITFTLAAAAFASAQSKTRAVPTRPWSGDHNMNPPEVPGMFFCNRPIDVERPGIIDVAPTVLDLFGVPIPPYMDGKPIMNGMRSAQPPGAVRESQGSNVPEPIGR